MALKGTENGIVGGPGVGATPDECLIDADIYRRLGRGFGGLELTTMPFEELGAEVERP